MQHDVGQPQYTEPSSQMTLGQAEAASSESDASSLGGDIEHTNQRVLLEADRVRAKFVSYVDTSTEVILRFDFINNHDTRVSQRMCRTQNQKPV